MAKLPTMDGRELLAKWLEGRTSQARFAAMLGCSEPHLSLVLARKRGVSLKLAKRISDATDGAVPMATLVLERATGEVVV